MSRSCANLATRLLLPALLACAATACVDEAGRAREQAAAQSAADETAAGAAAAAFDDAVAKGNWPLAKAQGDVLLARYPGTGAADRIRAGHAEAVAKAEAARATARLASLWTYTTQAVDGGSQLSAAIDARDRVDVDGSGPGPVQLIFRDHPSWGRSSYLVLKAGDFDCYGACRVRVSIDDGAPVPMAANRPDTDEAIAMFVDDERALWKKIDGAGTLAIEFPVKAGGTRTAVFEVGGLDRSRLPAWN
ncbi:MAG TPA: hypothetical protein VLK29_08915 [Luteimonas sp.]|nr:hypothetical protein [Luteimonas sp.]